MKRLLIFTFSLFALLLSSCSSANNSSNSGYTQLFKFSECNELELAAAEL